MKKISLAALFFLLSLSACSHSSTTEDGLVGAPDKATQLGTIYMNAGTQALQEQRYTDALSNLLLAVKNMPNSATAWNNLGIAYNLKGDQDKARESWQKALSIDKDMSDARNNLGVVYFNENKLGNAEKEFKTVLQDLVYTRAYQAHYNLSLIYLRQQKNIQAEQELELAVQGNQSYCPAWFHLGALQKDRGEFQAAVKSFKSSVVGPCFNNPEAQYEIADIYVRTKDFPKAKSKFLEVIELFPSSEWAKRAEANLNLMR